METVAGSSDSAAASPGSKQTVSETLSKSEQSSSTVVKMENTDKSRTASTVTKQAVEKVQLTKVTVTETKVLEDKLQPPKLTSPLVKQNAIDTDSKLPYEEECSCGSIETLDTSMGITPNNSSADIMEAYEEAEKSFQALLSLPVKRTRSPRQYLRQISTPVSPVRSERCSSSHQCVGLDQLDNLVKIMQQLSQLKEENNLLKRKCTFLEDSKTLLQAQNQMLTEVVSSPTLKIKVAKTDSNNSDSNTQLQEKRGSFKQSTRKRLSSAEDYDDINMKESEVLKQKRRTQSTGSLLDVTDSDLFEADHADSNQKQVLKQKSMDVNKTIPEIKSGSSSLRGKKITKWERVKMVFTGKQGESGHGSGLSIENPDECLGGDQGKMFSLSAMHQHDLASSEPSSPVFSKEVRIPDSVPWPDEDLTGGIWMGPPGWQEDNRSEDKSSLDDDAVLAELLKPKMGSSASVAEQVSGYLDIDTISLKQQTSPETERKAKMKIFEHSRSSSSGRDRASPALTKNQSLGEDEKDRKGQQHARTAWGRVKEIIHTRKDSIKKRGNRKLDEHLRGTDYYSDGDYVECQENSGGHLPRSKSQHGSNRASPMKSPAGSPNLPRRPGTAEGTSQAEAAAMLGGLSEGLSEEFSKKMQEWEEKKKKPIAKEDSVHQLGDQLPCNLTEDFTKKLEEWERIKAIKGTSPSPAKSPKTKEAVESPPPEVALENIQKSLTESFNRKMEEWEKIKYQRASSPSFERKSRKDDKSKSKKIKPKNEKDKKRKQSKDRHKARKEESKSPEQRASILIESASGEYLITEEFAKKLQEWEEMKGLKRDRSVSEIFTGQELSPTNTAQRDRSKSDFVSAQRSLSMTSPTPGSPSPISGNSPEQDKVDFFCNTPDEFSSLEEANKQLYKEVKSREAAEKRLLAEIRKLEEERQKMIEEYKKQKALYQKELWASSKIGHEEIGNEKINEELGELKNRLDTLEQQQKDAMAQKRKMEESALQLADQHGQAERKLLEEIGYLKATHLGKVGSPEEEFTRQDIENFCSNIVKLHSKMNDLQIGILERNKCLKEMKQQMVLQEVTNLLLQVDSDRRELEIANLRNQRKSPNIKRWKTFGGTELHHRQISGKVTKKNFDQLMNQCKSVKKGFRGADKIVEIFPHGQHMGEQLTLDWLEAMKRAGAIKLSITGRGIPFDHQRLTSRVQYEVMKAESARIETRKINAPDSQVHYDFMSYLGATKAATESQVTPPRSPPRVSSPVNLFSQTKPSVVGIVSPHTAALRATSPTTIKSSPAKTGPEQPKPVQTRTGQVATVLPLKNTATTSSSGRLFPTTGITVVSPIKVGAVSPTSLMPLQSASNTSLVSKTGTNAASSDTNNVVKASETTQQSYTSAKTSQYSSKSLSDGVNKSILKQSTETSKTAASKTNILQSSSQTATGEITESQSSKSSISQSSFQSNKSSTITSSGASQTKSSMHRYQESNTTMESKSVSGLLSQSSSKTTSSAKSEETCVSKTDGYAMIKTGTQSRLKTQEEQNDVVTGSGKMPVWLSGTDNASIVEARRRRFRDSKLSDLSGESDSERSPRTDVKRLSKGEDGSNLFLPQERSASVSPRTSVTETGLSDKFTKWMADGGKLVTDLPPSGTGARKSRPGASKGKENTEPKDTEENGSANRALRLKKFGVDRSLDSDEPESPSVEKSPRGRCIMSPEVETEAITGRISRFEKQGTSQGRLKKAPSPIQMPLSEHVSPVMSPVRKLKSAAELMQDSQTRRHKSRSSSTENNPEKPEDRIPSSEKHTLNVSDRLARKLESGSKVQHLMRNYSRETTPEPVSLLSPTEAKAAAFHIGLSLGGSSQASTPSANTPLSLSRVSSPGYQDAPPQLRQRKASASSSDGSEKVRSLPKDLTLSTCEGKVNKLKQAFGTEQSHRASPERGTLTKSRSTPERTLPTSLNIIAPIKLQPRRKSFENPREGTVAKNMEIFQSRINSIDSESPSSEHSSRRSSVTSPDGKPMSIVKPETASSGNKPVESSDTKQGIKAQALNTQLLRAETRASAMQFLKQEIKTRDIKGTQQVQKSREMGASHNVMQSKVSQQASHTKGGTTIESKCQIKSSEASTSFTKQYVIQQKNKDKDYNGNNKDNKTAKIAPLGQSENFDIGGKSEIQKRPLSPTPKSKGEPSSPKHEAGQKAADDEKKKSRTKQFMDSHWLQKPKKFFKISKNQSVEN